MKIFSKIVIWFLNNKEETLLILTGLIGGSLPTLWPLKDCLNFDILIKHFTSNKSFIICKSYQVVEFVFFILAGVVLILAFNRLKKPIEDD